MLLLIFQRQLIQGKRVADVMVHSNKTTEIHYYIRNPVILEDRVSTPVAYPNRKIWEPEEKKILRSILTDQIQCGSVTMEEIKDKRSELEAIEASERQLYDKARSLAKSADRKESQKRFL